MGSSILGGGVGSWRGGGRRQVGARLEGPILEGSSRNQAPTLEVIERGTAGGQGQQ